MLCMDYVCQITIFVYQVMAVDIWGLVGVFVAMASVVIGIVSVRQKSIELKKSMEDEFVKKTELKSAIEMMDKQITMIDKEICQDRDTNRREHDNLKQDFIRALDELRLIVLKALNINL